MQEEVVMADVNVFPFELINKFHRFKLSALPMPLPESELITLYTIRDANQYDGVENTLISGLAEKLHVSVPTISRCLSRLEEKGLTEEGLAIYEESFRTLSSFVERALARIDGEELNQFFATFDKIYDALAQEYNALGKK